MERYQLYINVLVWIGRLVALLSLFAPMGVVWAVILLLLAETLHIISSAILNE